MSIKICIVDDHQIFLDGIAVLLEEIDGFNVVLKTSDTRGLVESLCHHKVDVLLLDIEMPRVNGIELVKDLKKRKSVSKVLMLTMYNDSEIIKKSIKAGASGYILKNASREELIEAIQAVCNGDRYYSPDVMQAVMDAFQPQKNTSRLSGRELQIIQLIADQFTTREIADRLHLSPYTVETHRKNILLKLGLKNTAGLIKYSLQRGWIE